MLTSVWISGVTAVIIAWAMTGCRLGNHVNTAQTQNGGSGSTGDGISGYYFMQPQTLQLCAQSAAGTSCVAKPTNQIPAESTFYLSNKLANPIGVVLVDSTTIALWNGRGRLVSGDPDHSYFLVTTNPASELVSEEGTKLVALWDDANCGTKRTLSLSGHYRRETPQVSGSTVIYGRVPMDALVAQSFAETSAGACSLSMAKLVSCYHDLSKCTDSLGTPPADNQAWAIEILGDYYNAGIIDDTIAPGVTQLSFQVKYE